MSGEELSCGFLGCGKKFNNRWQLYRHDIDAHHPRYCLYCTFREGRGFVLRKHIEQQHPTVQLPEKGKKVRLYRNEGTPPLPIPPAPEQPVSAVFPTPEGYQPYTEDDIVAGSFEYVPTPISQCPSSATMAKSAEPQPSTSSSEGMSASSTVPGPSVSKQKKQPVHPLMTPNQILTMSLAPVLSMNCWKNLSKPTLHL